MAQFSVGANTFLVLAVAMVFLGGAAAQAVYRRQAILFIIPATAVFTLGLVSTREPTSLLVAMAFPLYAFVVLSATKNQGEAIRTATILRMRDSQMRTEAEHARAEAEAAKQKAEIERAAALQARQTAVDAHRASELSRLEAEKARAETEAQRLQADAARREAERANAAKTAFLAAASHDLRQPMHALVQYVGHLSRKSTDPTLADTIARSAMALQSMAELLNAILEVSKLMMGRVKPNVSSFPISRLLKSLDAQMRPLAEEKHLRFVVIDNATVVRSDEVQLERVVRNLILNAIRYTREGRVIVRCRSHRQMLCIEVWDDGIGIRKENLDRIFDEFFQADNDARDARKGLGLGLTIVRQLCDLLEHPIRVRSVYRKGSVFIVRTPLADVAEASETVAPDNPGVDFLPGCSIVWIDDNEQSLHATEQTLREFGSDVISARSGAEAIEKLKVREFVPNLIISDYRLGDGVSGIEAIRMVIANQQLQHGTDFRIPALVLSGDTAPTELAKVQEAGFLMLHKPVDGNVLRKAVNACLQRLALAET